MLADCGTADFVGHSDSDEPATDRKAQSERAELLKAIERGEKMIGQPEKVKLLRDRLPKHRLHYNSITDLAAYRDDLRQEYRRLHPGSESGDE